MGWVADVASGGSEKVSGWSEDTRMIINGQLRPVEAKKRQQHRIWAMFSRFSNGLSSLRRRIDIYNSSDTSG